MQHARRQTRQWFKHVFFRSDHACSEYLKGSSGGSSSLIWHNGIPDRFLWYLPQILVKMKEWIALCRYFSLILFLTLSLLLLTLSVCDELHPCEGLGRYATFRNFGMAFLLLFRVSTGDNWNGIMKVGKSNTPILEFFACFWYLLFICFK